MRNSIAMLDIHRLQRAQLIHPMQILGTILASPSNCGDLLDIPVLATACGKVFDSLDPFPELVDDWLEGTRASNHDGQTGDEGGNDLGIEGCDTTISETAV